MENRDKEAALAAWRAARKAERQAKKQNQHPETSAEEQTVHSPYLRAQKFGEEVLHHATEAVDTAEKAAAFLLELDELLESVSAA